MRSARGVLGQLMRCRNSPRNTSILFISSYPGAAAANPTAMNVAAAAAASAGNASQSPALMASIFRDMRKMLLNRPYAASGGKGKGKKPFDPADEKMLSEGGGSKDNYHNVCSRVRQTKRRSTIEKVLPAKRTTQQEMKRHARVAVKRVIIAAKKVTDKAKKGIDKAAKKTKKGIDKAKKGVDEVTDKVKDTGKKGGGGKKKGGGGGGKKGGGGGGKKGGGGGGKKGGGKK